MIPGVVAAVLGLSAPAAPPPDYSTPSDWLCLPGRTDVCSTPLPTTALEPNGYGRAGKSAVAENAPIDCFYVYPTSSNDQGLNSDLKPDKGGEILATETEFARFASVCRPFVPLYRQMTLGAVAAYAAGADITPAAELAFADVRDAWRTYLAKYNRGRPFVLVGSSQGSLMIQQLIQKEIEGKPIARQMKLAIIPGFNVLVPQGKLVGGTFKDTPLCSHAGETGCVITWNSFREKNPPPQGAMFGYADQPAMTVGCVNPGDRGARGSVTYDSYWYANSRFPVPGGPITWSTEGPPPTPYLRTEGLVSGRCVNDGPRGYLEIHTNADPKDKRTDRIGGDVGFGGMFLPGWGMHLSNMLEAQGDLIRQVGAVAAAEASARSRTDATR